MISRYSRHGIVWVDLESPTKEEIEHTVEEFDLGRIVGEEMVENTVRSKVDLYEDFMYLVLHFPMVHKGGKEDKEQEVDFIVGKKFLITVRYEDVDPIKKFAKIFESDALSDSTENHIDHGGFIFMQLMKEFYRKLLIELETMTESIRNIEHQIFSSEEHSMVRRMSFLSRKLLDFKQAVRFHGEVLRSYESASKRVFGEEYGYYAELITSEYNKVNSILDSHRDAISELQRTNDSLLSSKSNEIMRHFTVMAFIMFTLTVVVGIFGMNTKEFILIKNMTDFYKVIFGMGAVAFLMFAFFKIKKWL
jgi:magnesium transporter